MQAAEKKAIDNLDIKDRLALDEDSLLASIR
jgi:hypothetical protein